MLDSFSLISGAYAPNEAEVTMKAKPDDGTPVVFDANDIGSELLSLLSEGLYSNPLDALREYVQNAVDAKSKTVNIRFTGGSVSIHDMGEGMTLEKIHVARKFAVSTKQISANVGFRGIGIYSGFNLCKRMTILTKTKGDEIERELSFDFSSMRSIIVKERSLKSGVKTPLVKLLSNNVRLKEYKSRAALNDSFTQVQLQDISELHYGLISDSRSLRDYLVRNVPVDFEDDYPHRDLINGWLAYYSKPEPYNPVQINLYYDGKDTIAIRREMPAGIKPPVLTLVGDEKKPTAIIWSCLTEGKGHIIVGRTKVGGFVYRRKGFTIGTRDLLAKFFTTGSGTLFYWYVGEVHVLDDKVVPNAARNDFEQTDEFNVLKHKLTPAFKNLEKAGNDHRERLNFETALDRVIADIPRLTRVTATATDIAIRSEIESVIQELQSERASLPPVLRSTRSKEFQETIKALTNLDRLAEARLVPADTSSEAERESARAQATALAADLATDEGLDSEDDAEALSLAAVFEDIAARDGEHPRIFEMILDVLEDALADNPEVYDVVCLRLSAGLSKL